MENSYFKSFRDSDSPKNGSGYESALFFQRRQWLRWNDSTRRFDQIKNNPDKPKPMPVSNYFAKAINDNANQLETPKMTTTPGDDSDANRRGAQYGQRVLPAIDRETGFEILRPLLSKHVPLWGMGITWDSVDTSASSGVDYAGELSMQKSPMVSCLDCGQASPVTQQAPTTQAGNQQPDSDPNKPNLAMGDTGELDTEPEDQPNCPLCGSSNTVPFSKNSMSAESVEEFPKGRLCTEIVPLFEVYLPRDCRNPNLAKKQCRRFRKPLSRLKAQYGDRAKNIKAEAPYDIHQIYMEALRALVNYNYMHEQTMETTTITEIWCDWDELPAKVQDRLAAYWQQTDPQKVELAQRRGIYEIYAGGTMLDWGVNPWWDETEKLCYKPGTFFLWELDPANVYPKGVAIDLVPLQKRLNRIDSLVELGIMCNAAGKWLWPATQSGKPPTGSPNEVIVYEVIGDGKVAPTFEMPQPFHELVLGVRQGILGDFQALGNTLGANQGQPPPGVKSFRGQAYAGAKAEEQTNTQRFLWEQGHQLRYRKLLVMARAVWDSPRKVKVAGYNGKFGMMVADGQMLAGDYTVDVIADSSRPQLPAEKQQAFAQLAAGGMIDPTDSSVREYVADIMNMNEVNMTDHLQYEKAERDLEKLKQGAVPTESPFQKWDIFLKVFANFTLTEEFEALNPLIQQGILMYASHISQMMTMAKGGAPPTDATAMAQKLGQAIQGVPKDGLGIEPGSTAGSALNKVPGATTSPGTAQDAAQTQGATIASQLP